MPWLKVIQESVVGWKVLKSVVGINTQANKQTAAFLAVVGTSSSAVKVTLAPSLHSDHLHTVLITVVTLSASALSVT